MRRLELIIEQVRRQTENEEFSSTIGISDNEFVQYANDAQEKLHSRIRQVYPRNFLTEYTTSLVGSQEAYTLPSDIYFENAIDNVEISASGAANGFYPIYPGSMKERFGIASGVPHTYIRRNNTILLSPIPTSASGQLRINYVRRLPNVDIRRGRVGAVVLTSNGITSLSLDNTVAIDTDELNKNDYVCVVDRYGAFKMKAVKIDSVDASGVMTITPGFTFTAGESIAVGDYVVTGNLTTTHSQLPDTCERYVLAYMARKIFSRDSSSDSAEQIDELKDIEEEIITSFASIQSDDLVYPPVLDDSYLLMNGE